MDKLQEQLNQLKWLQHAGIEYYCSQQKDSKNSLMKKLKQISKDNSQDKMPKMTLAKIKTEIKRQPAKIKEDADLTINIANARKLSFRKRFLHCTKYFKINFVFKIL